MSESLIEAYRNAKSRHSSGGIHLVCLDDESLEESEYGTLGQRTIVPRSNKEGGIAGIAGLNDRKYGKGVRRREVNMSENGFIVESEEENFRPDNNVKTQEPTAEDPMSVLQDALLGNPTPDQNVLPAPNAAGSNQPSETMQMMQMMMQMMGQNGNGNGAHKPAPVKQAAPPKPKPVPMKSVTFGGDFGKFTAPYSDARVESGFILLAVSSEQPSSYEPPISPATPLQITIAGETHLALNVGLSFEYKGDIVTIMPLKAETPDDA